MKFQLNINCNNAAFRYGRADSDADPRHGMVARSQLALILRDAARHVENGDTIRNLMDVNGHTVGSFKLTGSTRLRRRRRA